MLYEILKTSKLGASFAPDMYTALWAQKLARDGEVKTLSGAPPLSFKANGTPLLDYLISGNTVQSGTPTPSNPVAVNGVGERTSNLAETIQGGISVSDGSDAAYKDSSSQIRTQYIPCEPNTNYVVSSTLYPVQNFVSFYDSSKVYISRTSGSPISQARAFTTPATAAYMRITFTHSYDDQIYPYTDGAKIMLNEGQTALPYEPYGYKIPISSASTTTPVYLGEAETTRKVKKLVFDGTENWVYQSAYTRFTLNIDNMMFLGIRLTPIICTHYITIDDGRSISDIPNNAIYIGGSVGATQIAIKTDNYTTLADFKSYLATQYAAGTPVTIWYVLATEEIGIVNEPLMKIGDYADTVSKAQAGVEIPTARGTNTLDVLTDVKPSEVYIKYKS